MSSGGFLEPGFDEKSDGLIFNPDLAQWFGGHHLELLWLLVGRTVENRGAEQPNIKRLADIFHKVGNEPFRGNHPGGGILQGNDNEETPMDPDDPTFPDQPGRRLFEGRLTESYGLQGVFPGKEIESLGLPGIHPAWQIGIF